MDRPVSAPPAPSATPLPDAVSLEREIEALKAFLARYPLPPSTDPREAPLGERHSEAAVTVPPPPAPFHAYSSAAEQRRFWLLETPRRKIIVCVAAAGILAAAALAGLPFRSTAGERPQTGTLSVTTTPSGMTVLIDGVPRSATPVTVDLPPGDHLLELVTGHDRRRIPVTIAAGAHVSHFFEIAEPPPTVSNTAAEPSVTAVPTAGSSESTAGWVSIAAPTDVQVLEDGRLLGSSRVDRLMLPVGRHELEFVNEALGYRAVQAVNVVAGSVVPVKLRWPQGSVALNAVPWAEVWIDGDAVGETPIGRLTLPIGVHEVLFRHPELGERRASVTVTMGKTTTLGVDMGAK
jgi:hypothetical protein